jgi:Flp pilus assembly protein TadG
MEVFRPVHIYGLGPRESRVCRGPGKKTLRERGQTIVELALVLPIFFSLIFGLMDVAWLTFQYQSVTNAAREGAREASILDPLFESGNSTNCSTGYGEPSSTQAAPAVPIESAVSSGSSLVSINSSAICASSSTSTSMTSSATQNGTATVTVVGSPSLAAPSTVTVTVSYVAHPLSPVFPAVSVTMTSSSTENVES